MGFRSKGGQPSVDWCMFFRFNFYFESGIVLTLALSSQKKFHHSEFLKSFTLKPGLISDIRPATYAAFCRNFGTHSTKVVGYRNWNEEALKAMSEDLEEPWDNLQNGLRTEMQKMEESVNAVFKSTMECLGMFCSLPTQLTSLSRYELRGCSNTVFFFFFPWITGILAQYPAADKALRQILKTRGRLVTSAFQGPWDAFDASMGRLRIDALTGIRTSIFGRSMEASYQACNRDHGR